MQISNPQSRHDLRLCPRLDRRPRRNRTGAPTEGGRVRKGVPREDHRHHGRPAAACQTDQGPRPRRVVITPAVDRLSATRRPLVIARDMQRAGAGIRSLAEPFLDTTSDFAEIIFAILGVAAKLERRRISNAPRAAGRTPRRRASNSAASRSSHPTSRKRPANASKRVRRSAASRAATMSARHDFTADRMKLEGRIYACASVGVIVRQWSIAPLSWQTQMYPNSYLPA